MSKIKEVMQILGANTLTFDSRLISEPINV